MVALIDIDSLFYKAAHSLYSIEYIEKLGLEDEDEDTIISTLVGIAANRVERMLLDILFDIEQDEHKIEITGQELFVTACSNSIRKELYPDYKKSRPRNPVVESLRNLYILTQDCKFDSRYEADDLIADRAKELGSNYVLVTMDKDLKQIGGLFYDFYCPPALKDEHGQIVEIFPRRGLSYISPFDAAKFLAKQMITGDSTDNIKGLPKHGLKAADRIIDTCKTKNAMKVAVIRAYIRVFGKDYRKQIQDNYRLLYLGKY